MFKVQFCLEHQHMITVDVSAKGSEELVKQMNRPKGKRDTLVISTTGDGQPPCLVIDLNCVVAANIEKCL